MQHVFIVGSKSLGAYGGYETFVYKLTEYNRNNKDLKFHVACKANGDGSMDETRLEGITRLSDTEFEFNNTHCFKIKIPNIGSAAAIYYDIAALNKCCQYIESEHIFNAVVYVLACRIGPFIAHFQKRIHAMGGMLFLNPDGHEWMRAKWSLPVRKYWKISEQMMVKHSDLVICDSINIERYIHECYDGKGIKNSDPKTTYIAYGAETRKSQLGNESEKLLRWYKEHDLAPKEYYLIVGRFVPENNYETMIREFMQSKTSKNFAIITNVNDKFLDKLENRLHFKSDSRIRFVGTVYDQELIKKIRENAYAYFHGHEVGGTNPSLLEALGSTDLNLLLDVSFNKEVALDSALYWTKKSGNLAALIEQADKMTPEQIETYGAKAKDRITNAYSWEFISEEYRKVFLEK